MTKFDPNRRREKYRKILASIRLRMSMYRHAGKHIQAVRIIERIQAILKPKLRA